MTFLSGQAKEAPVAAGRAKPIEPPQLLNHVCGLEPSKGKNSLPVDIDSSTIIASSGITFPKMDPIELDLIHLFA